jgi:hypothetical protein
MITPETIKVKSLYWQWVEGAPKEYSLTLYQSLMAVAPEKQNHHCESNSLSLNTNFLTPHSGH